MRTFGPSFGMTSGTRGCDAYQRSNSAAWLSDGACGAAVVSVPAAPAVTVSRGKNASAEAAPAKNRTTSAIARGLPASTRASLSARRGNVVIGTDVAAPETTNSPITAAYVVRQTRQTALIRKNEA